jgi:hypothetical protein
MPARPMGYGRWTGLTNAAMEPVLGIIQSSMPSISCGFPNIYDFCVAACLEPDSLIQFAIVKMRLGLSDVISLLRYE